MKTTWMMAGLMAMAAAASGRSTQSNLTGDITVCVDKEGLRSGLTFRAEFIAAKIYSAAGINIHWRTGTLDCAPGALIVSFRQQTPENFKPGALAYALPFEGTHICVFLDRIDQYQKGEQYMVLGHVLAHEITHILQGQARHSETGLMKARWSGLDVGEMKRHLLLMSSEDERLVRAGLAHRSEGVLMSQDRPGLARAALAR